MHQNQLLVKDGLPKASGMLDQAAKVSSFLKKTLDTQVC